MNLLLLGLAAFAGAAAPSPAPSLAPSAACINVADVVYGEAICDGWLGTWDCASMFGPGQALAGQCDLACGFCFSETGAPTPAAPACAAGLVAVAVGLYNSAGGWQGNALTLTSLDDGEVAFEATLDEGAARQRTACLAAGTCYVLDVGGGEQVDDLGWDACGESGGAPATATVCADAVGCAAATPAAGAVVFAAGAVAACGATRPVVTASVGGLVSRGQTFGVELATGDAAVAATVATAAGLDAFVAETCADAIFSRAQASWAVVWEPPILTVDVDVQWTDGVPSADVPGLVAADTNATVKGVTLTTFGGAAQHRSTADAAGASVFRLVDVAFSDAFGDGWNGAALEMSGAGGITYSGTLAFGHGAADEVLLAAGACYAVRVPPGAWPLEVSWSLCGGALRGGAPAEAELCIRADGTCAEPTAAPTPAAVRGAAGVDFDFTIDSPAAAYAQMDACGREAGPSRVTLAAGACEAVDVAAAVLEVASAYATPAGDLGLVGARLADVVAADGSLRAVLELDWGATAPASEGFCAVAGSSTLEIFAVYDAPVLSIEVSSAVNGTTGLGHARAGYAVEGAFYGDEAGRASRRTFRKSCEPPRPMTTAAAVAVQGTLSVNGHTLVDREPSLVADCGGRNLLVVNSETRTVGGAVAICGQTVFVSEAWLCGPGGETGRGEMTGEGAVAAETCSLEFDAYASSAATLSARVAPSANVTLWSDGFAVVRRHNADAPEVVLEGGFVSDCAVAVQLALELEAGDSSDLPSVTVRDYCSSDVVEVEDWHCTTDAALAAAADWTTASAAAFVDGAGGARVWCRASLQASRALVCSDALDDLYPERSTSACGALLGLGASCASEFCPTCSAAHRCDAACGFCAGETQPPTPQKHCADITMQLRDTYGDGWNGAAYSIYQTSDGESAADAMAPVTGTLDHGSTRDDALCLPDACFELSLSPGDFPAEVRWALCGASGDAKNGLEFCVFDGACEARVSPGMYARLGAADGEASCSGAGPAPVVTLALGADFGHVAVATIGSIFEDRSAPAGERQGQVFSSWVASDAMVNGSVVEWDDAPPGSETDCDMDAVATTAWTARLLDVGVGGQAVVDVTVTNTGGTSAWHNDGAGYTISGYESRIVALRDSDPSVETYFYRVAEMVAADDATFTLTARRSDGSPLFDGAAASARVVLADGTYDLSVVATGSWALCDDVSGAESATVVFHVDAGRCLLGTPAPTPAGTVVAVDGFAETHLRYAAADDAAYAPSCSGARLPKIVISVASPATPATADGGPWCSASLAPAFDDGGGGRGQIFAVERLDLADGALDVAWEDARVGSFADCTKDAGAELRWRATYAYPTLSLFVDAATSAVETTKAVRTGYVVSPGGLPPQLFTHDRQRPWTRERFDFDCADAAADGRAATARVRAANTFELWVNGVFVRSGSGWATEFHQAGLPLRCDGGDVVALRVTAGAGKFGFKAAFEACGGGVEATAAAGAWRCAGADAEDGWNLRDFEGEAAWAAAAYASGILDADRVHDLDEFDTAAGAGEWLWTKGRGLALDAVVHCRLVAPFNAPGADTSTPAPSTAAPQPTQTARPTLTPTARPAPRPTMWPTDPRPTHEPTAGPKAARARAAEGGGARTALIVFAALGAAALLAVGCYTLRGTPAARRWRVRIAAAFAPSVARRETELNEMMLPAFAPHNLSPGAAARGPSLAARIAQLHRPSGSPGSGHAFLANPNDDGGEFL
ncbi:hypothetical protein M885DRAFT_562659 [Pelagophyceae sp. CCMP2097]|nr:hypothetical protein M885DRAFT_562659 [Pelagophyceae sp. CCMP2097]